VPLCYAYTIQSIDQGENFPILTLPKTWCVRNSVVKLHAGWKKQMKDAGFSLKDLSPYGRRLRIAFTDDAVDAGTGKADEYIEPFYQSATETGGNLSAVFTAYDTDAGDTVSYDIASEYTVIVVPSSTEGAAPMELPAVMLSGSTTATLDYFRVVGQYLRSRNVMREVQTPTDSSLSPANYMVRLFSGAQPETDEIITEAQEYQDVRPYSMELDSSDNFSAEFETVTHQSFDENTGAGEISVISGVAPLGLLCLGDADGSGRITTQNDRFLITVHAIYEM